MEKRVSKVATVSLLGVSLVLTGCVSTAPRAYAPIISPPPADRTAFEGELSACASEVASGQRDFKPSAAAVAAGGVGGAAAVPVLGGAVAATSAGGGAYTALAASAVGLVLLVPVMTYSLSASRRGKNEQAVQQAMTKCLARSGRTVSGWTLVPRQPIASAESLTSKTPASPSS